MSQSPAGVPTCYRHPGRETHIRCQRCDKAICPDCMRDAAVGFQCPDCVKEGRKTTRSGRTAYGGLVPEKPGAVTMVLIGINAVVWLVIQATGRYGSWIYQHFALAPAGTCPAYPAIADRRVCEQLPNGQWETGIAHAPWELITSTFTHVEILHIGFNMYALWVLGPQLEQVLGRARYVALYLLSALAGSVAVLWLADPAVSTVGASGAVFGLMAALVVIGTRVKADLSSLWLWIGLNAVLSFTLAHVSWQGHLGGFIGGAIVTAALVYAPRQNRIVIQWAALGGIAALLLGAAALGMTMV
ncbi:rhomboid family intramembrane serine protease [Nocardioides maradonensis]